MYRNMTFENLKNWLEKNKIYFDTLVGSSSLVISLFAFFVAFQAAKDTSLLMERQARAEELAEQPFLTFRLEYLGDSDHDLWSDVHFLASCCADPASDRSHRICVNRNNTRRTNSLHF
jgi:hypothetical protein